MLAENEDPQGVLELVPHENMSKSWADNKDVTKGSDMEVLDPKRVDAIVGRELVADEMVSQGKKVKVLKDMSIFE